MAAPESTTSPAISQAHDLVSAVADIVYSTPTPAEFIDELIYEYFRRNRKQHSLESWAKIFDNKTVAAMETRYQQQLLVIFPRKVEVGLKRNYDVRCSVIDVTFGSTGEDALACGHPTVTCPGCGEWSGSCDDHLFEQQDGTRVCIECDGKPEFRRMGPDAAEVAELAEKARA